MTRGAQRAYLSLASVFLAIGGAGVGLGIVDALFGLGLFRGNPAPTATFLLAIGVALRLTALRSEITPDPARDAADDEGSPPP
jgi:hypothetical protein